MNELLAGGLGALVGYQLKAGASGTVAAPSNDAQIASLTSQLSVATQAADLLRSQLTAVTALKDLAQTNGQVGSSSVSALNSQIATLTNQLAALSTTTGATFPLAFGSGDPSLAGWVVGRDGLLVHRVLGNVAPTGMRLYTTSVTAGNPCTAGVGSGITTSDVYQRANARLVTLGRNVNTHLVVELPPFVDPCVAVVLNFSDDVVDDVDFVSFGAWGSYAPFVTRVLPIGRHSLMILALAAEGTPYNNAWTVMEETLIFGTSVASSPDAEKWTGLADRRARFCLTHRTARALTLKSVALVANPLFAANETSVGNDVAELANNVMRLRGGASRLLRLHTTATPAFYRVSDTTKALESVEIPTSSYTL